MKRSDTRTKTQKASRSRWFAYLQIKASQIDETTVFDELHGIFTVFQ